MILPNTLRLGNLGLFIWNWAGNTLGLVNEGLNSGSLRQPPSSLSSGVSVEIYLQPMTGVVGHLSFRSDSFLLWSGCIDVK